MMLQTVGPMVYLLGDMVVSLHIFIKSIYVLTLKLTIFPLLLLS